MQEKDTDPKKMEGAEGSPPPKRIKLESTEDDLRHMMLKRGEAYALRQKGTEAFVRNNHNDAVRFFQNAMEVLRSIYDDDDIECKIARLNLSVAMRAQEIVKNLATSDIIKLRESVLVVDPNSLTDAELIHKVKDSGIIINPMYYTLPELIDLTNPIGKQMIAVIADLNTTVGCTEMEIGCLVEAKFSYMKASYMLELMREEDLMFSDYFNLTNSIRDELAAILRPENRDRPVDIGELLLIARRLKANFSALHLVLSVLPQNAGAQQALWSHRRSS